MIAGPSGGPDKWGRRDVVKWANNDWRADVYVSGAAKARYMI